MSSVSLSQVLSSHKAGEIMTYLEGHLDECSDVPPEEFLSVFRIASNSHAGSHVSVEIGLLESPVMQELPVQELREMIRNVGWSVPGPHPRRCEAILGSREAVKLNPDDLRVLSNFSQCADQVAAFAKEKLAAQKAK